MAIPTNLPEAPTVGLTFRPDTTDSIGTVKKVTKDRRGWFVEYSYEHAPAVTYGRPWAEVRNLGWAVAA
jgi:hypothetical protein